MGFLPDSTGVIKRVKNLLLFRGGTPTPPPAPPVLVQFSSQFTDFGAEQAVNIPAPVTTGNTVLLCFFWNGIPTFTNFRDNAGNVYTLDYDQDVPGYRSYFLRCSNVVGNPTQVLWDSDLPTLVVANVFEYSGLDNVAPLVASGFGYDPNAENFSLNIGAVPDNSIAIGCFTPTSFITEATAVPPTVVISPFGFGTNFGMYRACGVPGDTTMGASWTGQANDATARWACGYKPAGA